jgi:replicative DNA helicase
LAKELHLPIIQLSQLNRSVEDTKLKEPELHHLKESGSIEEDSYGVIFVYRPEYYQIANFEDGESTDNKAELIIAKHRNGETGKARIMFDKEYMHFRDGNSMQISLPVDNRITSKGTDEDFFK